MKTTRKPRAAEERPSARQTTEDRAEAGDPQGPFAGGARVQFVPDALFGTLVKRCIGLPVHEAKGRAYWVQIDGEEEGTHLLCLESELAAAEG